MQCVNHFLVFINTVGLLFLSVYQYSGFIII